MIFYEEIHTIFYVMGITVGVLFGFSVMLRVARLTASSIFDLVKKAIIEAFIEILGPVLREALIKTIEDPRFASALTLAMKRVMAKEEMKAATKSFATDLAEEAIRSKAVNKEAAKFTGSLLAEILSLLKDSMIDAADKIPLLGSAVGKCMNKRLPEERELLDDVAQRVDCRDRRNGHRGGLRWRSRRKLSSLLDLKDGSNNQRDRSNSGQVL
mmetsp:Transcript_11724/g.16392  ORF Transcript_11724/g.16392 Transcript_11724/m.16392 type:complete len:213 (+) Transcript_11724:158-796(+)